MKSLLLAAYAVAAAGNIAAGAVHGQAVDRVTKPLLMPLLAAYAVAVCREREVPVDRRLLVALALAFAGDVALEVPWAGSLILGMLCFLGAYGTYAGMFLRAGALRRLRPVVVAGYLVFSGALLVWLWPGLSVHGLAVPMAVYAAALTAMAMTASTQGPLVAAGGALLLCSDALIGIGIAGAATMPGPPIWVMLTYTLGQALVVTGWVGGFGPVVPVRHARRGRRSRQRR